MSTIFGIIIFVCVLIFLLILRGIKGPVHTIDTLHRPIDDLLQRGFNGGFLIITISYSKKFIQLSKYINSRNEHGIELAFPKAKWSLQFFKKLENLCIEDKIPYSIENGIGKNALDFLHINFGNDSKKAYEIVKNILMVVFGVDNRTKIFVRLENASIE